MHRERLKIGSKLFDAWVYLTFTIGIITEVCGAGYLLFHHCIPTIGG